MAVSLCTSWRVNRILVFCLTYFSYAFCHAARKTFSNVKSAMAEQWLEDSDIFNDPRDIRTKAPLNVGKKQVDPFLDTIEEAEIFLGFLDTVFLVSYAIGLYVCGVLGDRINMRNLLVFGMTTSAIMMFMFGTVSEWLQYYNRIYYTLFWILNGFFQGTTWPILVAIMGNWYGSTRRGLIFGLWSSSASIGNIIGAFSVSMSINVGYQYAFLTTSAFLIIWSVIILIFLSPTPTDAGLVAGAEEEEEKSEPSIQLSGDESEESPLTVPTSTEPIGFIEALLMPGVVLYSISFGFLKMVHYSILFWLPFYLTSSFLWSDVKSSRFSMFYDIGGIPGGTLGGLFTDFAGRRVAVVMAMLILSMISLFGYNFIEDDELWNGLGMLVVGFFVCGVTHVVSSVVVADLGQQDAIKRNNKEALSTVTGIVDGTGTIGAAIGQIIIPLLLVSSGWESVFYFLTIMLGCSSLALLPVLLGSISSHVRGSPTSKQK
ncbi:sugar phosphate exchanger 3-like [Apostichopus japonicus]|uniref:sugar phosphate exchanger 3-like n=1 Tax=Stichopus japonicus TaxID=307972 RepID=UPI003AB7961D